LRRLVGRQMTGLMEARLGELSADVPGLYAAFAKAGGDTRGAGALEDEGRRTLAELRHRGFDLGPDAAGASLAETRLQTIYDHARRALYAQLEESVLRDASPRHVRARTAAVDRDDYLAHPPSGERLRAEDESVVAMLYPARRPQVQIVVSDGLNANAVNEQLRALLPPTRRMLSEAGHHVGETDVVLRDARVRAGYHVGQLLDAAVVIHVIGERPGTGLNTLSAYVTYGFDDRGRSRWSTSLDHSCTNAVCGIHPHAKRPLLAAAEITRLVTRMFEQGKSGVQLAWP
jgi:ethanolamine ammonia-lyase large subunit